MPRKKLAIGDKVFVPMEDGTIGLYEITGTQLTVKDRNGDESSFSEDSVYLTMKGATEYLSSQFTTFAEPKPRRGRSKKQEEPQNENTAPVVQA
jgi:hypothetical protein